MVLSHQAFECQPEIVSAHVKPCLSRCPVIYLATEARHRKRTREAKDDDISVMLLSLPKEPLDLCPTGA